MYLANDWKKTARGQALEVLEEVFQEGAYSNIALNAHLSKSHLTDKDKALVTEIVYGTVARKITLEWILAHVIEDRDKLEPWVYDLLLLSLYQLAYLDKIPAHAVVNDAVSIAKNRGNKKGAEKLVNAVLRKLSSQPLPDPSQIKRVNKRYSVQYSLPVWLVKKLIDQYGEDRALAIFQSLFVRNKASVRVTDASRLKEIAETTGADRSVLSPVGLVKSSGYFAVQLEILSSVCQTLRKGGIITYSTCTIIAEENQEVIQAFLESHPDFEQVALDHPCKDIVVNGCLAITPEQYLTDGFFIAQLRKKA